MANVIETNKRKIRVLKLLPFFGKNKYLKGSSAIRVFLEDTDTPESVLEEIRVALRSHFESKIKAEVKAEGVK